MRLTRFLAVVLFVFVVAPATYCYSNCWTDYYGNTHCSWSCF